MDIGIAHGTTTLESRFVDHDQPVLLTGIQALLRLLLEQKRLDTRDGLNTAGFVSGYRGSPLGGLDRELWLQKKMMEAHAIKFEPGVNEDLAATMLLGTQPVAIAFRPIRRLHGTAQVFAQARGIGTGRVEQARPPFPPGPRHGSRAASEAAK